MSDEINWSLISESIGKNIRSADDLVSILTNACRQNRIKATEMLANAAGQSNGELKKALDSIPALREQLRLLLTAENS